MAQKIFYSFLCFVIFISILSAIYIPKELNLNKYKDQQIIEIKSDWLFGDACQIYNLKTKEVSIVKIYQIAIKDYKVGDIIK